MRAVTEEPKRSRWDTVRRRWAPLAMFVVLGLLVVRTCRAESTKVTIEVDLGAGAARARSLSVEYFRDGESERVGYMRLEYGPGGAPGPARQPAQLDRGGYRAVIEVGTDAGTRRFERRFRVGEHDTIRLPVDLDDT